MKVPISNRLLSCAKLVPEGAKVADVGCDHGYLGIYLLQQNIARFVHAMDLRPMPLNNAKRHSAKYGVDDHMEFHVCHGVNDLQPGDVDCVVCAGMGGDTILSILEPISWIKDNCTLILQPQSAGDDLRKWLGAEGFAIQRETLSEDAGKIYSTLVASYTGETWDVPLGQQYASKQLMESGSGLLNQYLDRVEAGLRRSVEGLKSARREIDPARLSHYETALAEILEMREHHG